MACEMSFFQTNAHHPPFCFARLRCNEMLLPLVLVLVSLPSCSADPALPVPGGGCWNWPWSSGMSSSWSSSSQSSRQTHATPPANDGRLQVTTALTAARASSSIMVRGGFTTSTLPAADDLHTSQPEFRRCSDDDFFPNFFFLCTNQVCSASFD